MKISSCESFIVNKNEKDNVNGQRTVYTFMFMVRKALYRM